MTSISELCSAFATALNCPYNTVYQYARSLQLAGMIPTSKGRSIEPMQPDHALRLLLALALRPKFNDTAELVQTYANLTGDGVMPSFPAYLQETVLDRMRYSIILITAPQGQLREDLEGPRQAERRAEYQINLDDPEVELLDDGLSTEVYRDIGVPGRKIRNYRRSFTFSGRIFDDLEGFFELPESYISEFADKEHRLQDIRDGFAPIPDDPPQFITKSPKKTKLD